MGYLSFRKIFFFSGNENWDDWEDENEEENGTSSQQEQSAETKKTLNPFPELSNHPILIPEQTHRKLQSDIDTLVKNVQDLDILKLDIKVPSKIKTDEEVDFFADMTPNIPKQKSSLEKFQVELETAKQVRF